MMMKKDKYGRWIDDSWIVSMDREGQLHCSVGYSIQSAERTAQVMMLQQSPYYMPPLRVWAIEASTRYQAMKIAKKDLDCSLIR